MSDKFFISYDQLENDTLQLAEKLAGVVTPDTQLVAISRGGLFIGGMLSYALGLKDVHCVSLESYTDDSNGSNGAMKQRTPFPHHIAHTPLSNLCDKLHLVVDDINDTSQTYRYIQEYFNTHMVDFRFATTYHKARTDNLTPDYIGRELDPKCWVVFPWDKL